MSNDIKKKKAPSRRKYRFWLILGGFLVMQWFCWGIYINLSPVRPIDELEQARAKWEMQDVDDYQLNFSKKGGHSAARYSVKVVGGKAVKIIEFSFDLDVLARNPDGDVVIEVPGWNYNWGYDEVPYFMPMDLAKWTMEGIFDLATEKLKDKPAPVPISLCGWDNEDITGYSADYDAVSGNITRLGYTCQSEWNVGLGAFCWSGLSHCVSGIYIDNIEPLSTPEK